MTDDLLDRLSEELRPARARMLVLRLIIGLALGVIPAFLGVSILLGLRADMPQAVLHGMFWIKLAYTGGLAMLGVWCVERLSRPAGDAGLRLPWLGLPIVAIAGLAAIQLWAAPPTLRASLMMGASAAVCSWFILATALPVLVALIWAMRGLAPTRLGLAGAIAGLTAGGAGAAVYALHCPESAAPFIAIWYTLGMVLSGGAGALLGPHVLRW